MIIFVDCFCHFGTTELLPHFFVCLGDMEMRMVKTILVDCLCQRGTAGLLPLVLATLLRVEVGEEAEHLDLDLAELGLGVGRVHHRPNCQHCIINHKNIYNICFTTRSTVLMWIFPFLSSSEAVALIITSEALNLARKGFCSHKKTRLIFFHKNNK